MGDRVAYCLRRRYRDSLLLHQINDIFTMQIRSSQQLHSTVSGQVNKRRSNIELIDLEVNTTASIVRPGRGMPGPRVASPLAHCSAGTVHQPRSFSCMCPYSVHLSDFSHNPLEPVPLHVDALLNSHSSILIICWLRLMTLPSYTLPLLQSTPVHILFPSQSDALADQWRQMLDVYSLYSSPAENVSPSFLCILVPHWYNEPPPWSTAPRRNDSHAMLQLS